MNRHVIRVLSDSSVLIRNDFCIEVVSPWVVFVGYRDLLQVVQEHAVFKCPSMVLLSVSLGSFVPPSSCKRRKPSFLANFGSVYGFPVMVLPPFRSMTLSLSSSLDNVQRFCKAVDSSANFIFVFLRGYQTLTASAENCSLFGMSQAYRTQSCSDCFAKFVQLDVSPSLLACALIPRWTPWISLLVSGLWWWTCRDIRLAVCQPKFASRSSAPRLCRCRLVMLHELEDRLETSLLLSQHCLGLGPPASSSRGSSWTVLWSSSGLCLACSFPRLLWLKTSCSVAAAHSRHFWEQYVVQVSVMKITGKIVTSSCCVRWFVQYSLVAPCCLWWLHAISFAKTLCLFSCALPRWI